MAGVDKLFCKGRKIWGVCGLHAVSVPTIHLCSYSSEAAITICKQMGIPVCNKTLFTKPGDRPISPVNCSLPTPGIHCHDCI